ncbi:MAG TPA: hypothetical protein VHU13_07505, partial [Solirubrobacteraceae bacterium]|nr:hypothetical protein [Solirubrobacteraceae bacterium]
GQLGLGSACIVKHGPVVGVGARGMILLALALSGCGSSQTDPTNYQYYLNTSRIALAIEQSILSQRGLHAHVYCPTEIPQIKGQRFTCIASSARLAPTIFTVMQIDARGHVQYAAK